MLKILCYTFGFLCPSLVISVAYAVSPIQEEEPEYVRSIGSVSGYRHVPYFTRNNASQACGSVFFISGFRSSNSGKVWVQNQRLILPDSKLLM
jgi:hypothetical protein